MTWTAERTDILTRRWAEGASVRAIMRELDLTSAGAVAGKVMRLRNAGQNLAARDRKKAQASKVRTRKPRKVPAKQVARIKAEIKAIAVKTTADDDRTDLIGLFDLTGTTCRWPIGDPTRGFCGHKAPLERPYCDAHERRARSVRQAR